MSASLVGSEMCIRDRCVRSALNKNSASAQFATRSDVLLMRRMPYEGAVSYTHLTLPTICSV
eukprot:11373571-Alexandrium_andersonii.AAC.1